MRYSKNRRAPGNTPTYEKGIKVTKAEMATLNLHRDTFHPEWNYTIEPRSQT
jgi:hypothetical protein